MRARFKAKEEAGALWGDNSGDAAADLEEDSLIQRVQAQGCLDQ